MEPYRRGKNRERSRNRAGGAWALAAGLGVALAGLLLVASLRVSTPAVLAAGAAGPGSVGAAPTISDRLWPASAGSASLGGTEASSRNRIAVKIAGNAARGARVAGSDLREVGTIPALGIQVFEGGSEEQAREGLEVLRRTAGVSWAEPVKARRASVVPDDPGYKDEWWSGRVGLPEAWDTTTGSPGVVVAVLDSGLDGAVADFRGRIVSPYSVIDHSSAGSDWRDTYGHGTGVAAVAAAAGNDGLGIAGASWGVGIMPVKIAEENETDDVALAEGIVYAVDHGAQVVNISYGGEQSAVEDDAVAYALAHHVTVVAAAGNRGAAPPSSTVQYPAALPGVIAVGATDQADLWATFSSTGPELDLVAPGDSIYSYGSLGSDRLGYHSGTSYAAPVVAGTVALMLSVDPGLTPERVADILYGTAKDLGSSGWDSFYGAGLLQAGAALQEVKRSSSTTTSSTSPATTSTTLPVPIFADVTPSVPYFDQIQELAVRGVISGKDDGLFHPADPLLRMQFAKMIVLAAGYPVSLADTWSFKDVPDVSGQLYPFHYVAVAAANGLTEGTGPQSFSPYRNVTRAQMITMAARAARLPDPPITYAPPFPDFSPDHYGPARKAAYTGLLDGLSGMGPGYDFWVAATRGEACALLARLLR